jgi:hypothetical protein
VNSWNFSLEFHGIFHGVPWKKIHEKIRQMFMKIPWNSMEFHETEVDGISFRELTEFDGIRFRQGRSRIIETSAVKGLKHTIHCDTAT